ncbi:MAG: enoyl-CoA hydratase [Candidatus Obscuribacterales bacterium]|nr:enoyl-CoA hydratase [Steroidobacteraceae bacterium]
MSDALLESLQDGVLTLTMNRPEKLNALSTAMGTRLLAAVQSAALRAEVKVIVLTGAGKGFCAGGDVEAMAEGDGAEISFEQRMRGLRASMEISRLLHESPKPTIAMLRGACAGAGMSLALACDLRISSDTLKFTTAFAKVGLSGDFGGTWYLTQLLGSAKAKELYLLSPVLRADEAERLGLVSRVVPDAELESETRKLALTLAQGASVAQGYIKKNINAAEYQSLAEVMDLEAMHHTHCATTADHREAAAAFVAKRTPVFKGA